jgi:hypothetical protein
MRSLEKSRTANVNSGVRPIGRGKSATKQKVPPPYRSTGSIQRSLIEPR